MNPTLDPDGMHDPNGRTDIVDVADLTVGTASWVQRTSGRLSSAERRALLRPLARTHIQNAVGRIRLALGVHPGRHAYLREETASRRPPVR